MISRLHAPPILRPMLAPLLSLTAFVIPAFRIRRVKTRLNYAITVMPTISAQERGPSSNVPFMPCRPHSLLTLPSVTVIGATKALITRRVQRVPRPNTVMAALKLLV